MQMKEGMFPVFPKLNQPFAEEDQQAKFVIRPVFQAPILH